MKLIGIECCVIIFFCFAYCKNENANNESKKAILLISNLTLKQIAKDDPLFLTSYELENSSNDVIYLIQKNDKILVTFTDKLTIKKDVMLFQVNYYPYIDGYSPSMGVPDIALSDSAELYYKQIDGFIKNKDGLKSLKKDKFQVIKISGHTKAKLFKIFSFMYEDYDHLIMNVDKIKFIFKNEYFKQNDSLIIENTIVPSYKLIDIK